MSQFDFIAAPQARTGAIQGPNITASVGATARISASRCDSINFAGSAAFCRPRS